MIEHAHRDYAAARMGMWIFLLTELLLFGGLFLAYSVYRRLNPIAFHHASGELDVVLGVANTIVLLTSSLTMAVAVTAVRRGNKRLSLATLAATILFGALFLVNKYVEWMTHIHHGVDPGSPQLMQREPGERLFFGLYYMMTGLHGLHVLAGVSVLSVMAVLVLKNSIGQDDPVKIENAGLYWHLVDIVWIFLLPLFYLAA